MMKTLSTLFNACLSLVLVISSVGPLTAQWIQTKGPSGGNVLCFTSMVGNRLFAGTEGAGIFISEDQGQTWQPTTFILENRDIYAMASVTNLLFVASYSGLTRSHDYGETWTMMFPGIGYSAPEAVFILDDVVFIGTNGNGIYRSEDYGETWENVLVKTEPWSLNINSITGRDSVLLASSGNRVYRSTDLGLTWEVLDVGSNEIYLDPIHIHDEHVFAGTLNKGLFRSSDLSESWESLMDSLPSEAVYSISSNQDFVFVLADDGIWRSADNGETWVLVNTDISHHWNFALFAVDSLVFAGTSQSGIFRSANDGLTWENQSLGVLNMDISDMVVFQDTLYVSTKGRGVFSLGDIDDPWLYLNAGLDDRDGVIRAMAVWQDHLFSEANDSLLYIYVPETMSWTPYSTGIDSFSTLCLHVHQGHLFAGGRTGLFRMDSLGSPAVRVDQVIMAPASLYWRDMLSVGDTLFASNGKLYWSVDLGESWHLLPGEGIPSIDAIGYQDGFLFAGTWQSQCYRWDPVTMNWGKVNEGLESTVEDFFLLGDQLLAGGYLGGIHRTFDYGEHWHAFNEGMNSPYINKFQPFKGYMFIGTRETSVWRRHLNDFLYINDLESVGIGSADWIDRMYPNPARDQVYIDLDLPFAMDLRVRIMDPLGRTCSVEPGASFPAGKSQLTLALPSGVSGICRVVLQSGTQIQSVPLFVQQE